MSIPLDRLYHYIESVAQEITSDNVLIYRFFPHGSKKIEDLGVLSKIQQSTDTLIKIHLICHDQEPLNYDLYHHCIRNGSTFDKHQLSFWSADDLDFFKLNLRDSPHNIYDKCILLHSEINSAEVEKYANNQFITVYYWNHAVLAQDWYRYAQHIKKSKAAKTKKFLIYNRAWTGTREYRLKLADLLIDYQLLNQCQTSCSFVDSDTKVHYTQHKFINNKWKPTHQLELYYNDNCYPAHCSADFDLKDYQATDIEVVLETLFDDSRIHLTEKSLRPIALGHSFILLGPAGSLKYLKNYGFKTFDSVLDESYDDILDPHQRLTAVIKLMDTIRQLPHDQYQELLNKLNAIAEYNKNHFFSDTFTNTVNNELINNLSLGVKQLISTNTYERFLSFRSAMANNKSYIQWRDNHVLPNIIQETAQVYQQILNLKNQ